MIREKWEEYIFTLGVFSVAVLSGYNSKEKLLESVPDLVIDNLCQLSDYLSRKQR